MELLQTNNAESTLAAPLLAAGVTVTLPAADSAKFPTPTTNQGFFATLERKNTGAKEIVLVTAHAGVNLTIVRAQESIAGAAPLALDFAVGDIIACRVTKAQMERALQPSNQYFPVGAYPSAGDFQPPVGYTLARVTAGGPGINRFLNTGLHGGERFTLYFLNFPQVVTHAAAPAGAARSILTKDGANINTGVVGTPSWASFIYDQVADVFYQV